LLHPLAKLHRATGAAPRAARSAEGEELPHVDPARFVGRVARAFHTAQERGGMLQIRLSPPELGALRLELTVKDGVLAASLETENSTARRVLLDHLPALRERLAEQNIRLERFDVDVRQEGGGQSQSGPHHHRQQHSQPHDPSRNASRQPTPTAEATPTTPTPGNRAKDTQINLVA
jgi:flagellar hook-length control protein FliK